MASPAMGPPRLGPPVPPDIRPEPEPRAASEFAAAAPQDAGIAGAKQKLQAVATEIAGLAPLIEGIDPTLVVHIGTMVNAGAALANAIGKIEQNQAGGGGAEPEYQPQPAEPAPALG